MRNIRGVAIAVILVFSLLIIFIFGKVEPSIDGESRSLTKSPQSFMAPGWGQKSSAWAREEVFLSNNTFLQQGGGYKIKAENYKVLKMNKKPFKILMFGDSYTWGHGADNSQSNISLALQERLNELSAPNTFLVIPWAANGRNTYNYVDEFTPERVKELDPDLVIYNYVYNDGIPNFEESMICISEGSCKDKFLPKKNPIYIGCLKGESTLIGWFLHRAGGIAGNKVKSSLLNRYCEPVLNKLSKQSIDEEYISYHPLANPYFEVWKKAVKRLAVALKGRSIYVLDLKNPLVSMEDNKVIKSIFLESGWRYLDVPWLDERMSNFNYIDRDGFRVDGMTEMSVNPGDAHYSFYYNKNIANQVADRILKDLGEGQVRELINNARINNTGYGEEFYNKLSLVNNSMPVKVRVVNRNVYSSEISYVKKDQEGLYAIDFQGSKALYQGVNCLNIGHPNIVVNLDFNKTASEFKEIRVKSRDSKVSIGYYLFDKDGRKTFFVSEKDGNSLVLPKSNNVIGYSLIFYEKSLDCPEDKVIDMTDFSAEISLV